MGVINNVKHKKKHETKHENKDKQTKNTIQEKKKLKNKS